MLSGKIRTKWIIGRTKWIIEYFSYLALAEYRTKWIRIMRGPGVITRKFYFKIFFATLCLLVSSLSQIFRILLLLWNNDSSMHWVTGNYSQLGDLLWSKLTLENILTCTQKYSRLRCLLRVKVPYVKGLVICIYLAGLTVFFSSDKI